MITQPTPSPRRPWLVTLAAISFIPAGLIGLLRMVAAVLSWQLLDEIQIDPTPYYLAGLGLLWGLVGLTAAVTLWVGVSWAPWAAMAALAFIQLTFWLDRLWILNAGNPLNNWPFLLAFCWIWTILVLVAIWLPRSRAYFQRNRTTPGEI